MNCEAIEAGMHARKDVCLCVNVVVYVNANGNRWANASGHLFQYWYFFGRCSCLIHISFNPAVTLRFHCALFALLICFARFASRGTECGVSGSVGRSAIGRAVGGGSVRRSNGRAVEAWHLHLRQRTLQLLAKSMGTSLRAANAQEQIRWESQQLAEPFCPCGYMPAMERIECIWYSTHRNFQAWYVL